MKNNVLTSRYEVCVWVLAELFECWPEGFGNFKLVFGFFGPRKFNTKKKEKSRNYENEKNIKIYIYR